MYVIRYTSINPESRVKPGCRLDMSSEEKTGLLQAYNGCCAMCAAKINADWEAGWEVESAPPDVFQESGQNQNSSLTEIFRPVCTPCLSLSNGPAIEGDCVPVSSASHEFVTVRALSETSRSHALTLLEIMQSVVTDEVEQFVSSEARTQGLGAVEGIPISSSSFHTFFIPLFTPLFNPFSTALQPMFIPSSYPFSTPLHA